MKILVLSCSTGGGHNSCAKYITQEFLSNNILCDYKDYLEIVGKKVANIVEKIYLDSTKGNGKIFEGIYKIGEIYNKSKIKSPVYIINKLAKEKLLKFIKENKYDLIICTHLFPSMTLTEIKKSENINFINVATDYECIPFWNETTPDYFVIPNKLLINKFIEKGFNKDIILPFGIPVSSKFAKSNVKIKLPENKKIVLITSGSMGFGNMINLVNSLLQEIKNVYFIIICGNNKKLKNELDNIKNKNLLVIGYTNNMSSYMKKSDVIISKPGGLTSTEVASLNKPLIHMMPIPGVENYNAEFFNNNKMSLKADNIKEVIEKTNLLIANEELQKEIINNQKRIINKNSAADLVKFVLKKYQTKEKIN